jgi:hypothetical protein
VCIDDILYFKILFFFYNCLPDAIVTSNSAASAWWIAAYSPGSTLGALWREVHWEKDYSGVQSSAAHCCSVLYIEARAGQFKLCALLSGNMGRACQRVFSLPASMFGKYVFLLEKVSRN